MGKMNFDIQKFATDYVRDAEETMYSGRRRIAGNFGRLWIGGELIFEISAFQATITADREDVIIGVSKDSKVVSLTGEGEFTIKMVFNRGFKAMMEDWQKGHDTRLEFVGEISDPDALGHGVERIKLQNVWLNQLEIMKFEKGTVVEKTIQFGWTPSDTTFESVIEKVNSGTGIDS